MPQTSQGLLSSRKFPEHLVAYEEYNRKFHRRLFTTEKSESKWANDTNAGPRELKTADNFCAYEVGNEMRMPLLLRRIRAPTTTSCSSRACCHSRPRLPRQMHMAQ